MEITTFFAPNLVPFRWSKQNMSKPLISAYVSKSFWNRLFQTFFPQQQRDGIFTAQPPSSQGKETCQKSHASATGRPRQWCCVVFVGVWKQSSGWNSWDIWGFSKCSSANKNRLLCHLGWLTSKITTVPLKPFEVGRRSGVIFQVQRCQGKGLMEVSAASFCSSKHSLEWKTCSAKSNALIRFDWWIVLPRQGCSINWPEASTTNTNTRQCQNVQILLVSTSSPPFDFSPVDTWKGRQTMWRLAFWRCWQMPCGPVKQMPLLRVSMLWMHCIGSKILQNANFSQTWKTLTEKKCVKEKNILGRKLSLCSSVFFRCFCCNSSKGCGLQFQQPRILRWMTTRQPTRHETWTF